ncbi:MAG: hypothetical protein D6714_20500, partial [Bacteroidetes bacterium]
MKSFAIFFFFSAFLTFHVSAQTDEVRIDWAKTFGKSSDDVANDILEDAEGNLVLVGTTKPKGARLKDLDILKLSADGSLLWGKKFGKSGNDVANAIAEAGDGGYVVAGTSSLRGRTNQLSILKISQGGVQVWVNTYKNRQGGEATDIIRTSDGGFLAVGHTRTLAKDALVVKFGQYGDVEWGKTFGGPQNEEATAVVQLPDGNFVLTGKTNAKSGGGSDLWLLYFDNRGRVLREFVYGGYRNESGEALALTRDGNLLVAGQQDAGDAISKKIWILKIGQNGKVLWERTFGQAGAENVVRTLIRGHAGYLVGGYVNTFSGSREAWVLSINEHGKRNWEKRFEGRRNPTLKVKKEGTEARALVATRDGGYVLAGNSGLFLMNKLII